MKVAIIGAGAIGSYFGGKLALTGNEVTFVARGRQYEALRDTGLTLVTDHDRTKVTGIRVVPRISDLTAPDAVLVTVKGWDTEQVARDLAVAPIADSVVLSLQNGVSARATLGAHLPDPSLLGGLCYINAAVTAPAEVTRTGNLQQVTFGEFNRKPSARTTALRDALTRAGVDATVSDDIDRALWEKFVFLVGFSALTSAVRAPIGTVRTHPPTRSLLTQVIAETVAVAATVGVNLPDTLVQQTVEFCDSLPPQAVSSMAVDLQAGRRLELPWLTGHVVTLADRAGLEVPANRVIAALLEPFERGGN